MREWINIWSKFHAWDPRPHPSWKASESNANYISNLPPKYQRKLEECKTLRRIAKHHFSVCCFFIITINNPSNQLKKLTILKETFPCSVFITFFLFIPEKENFDMVGWWLLANWGGGGNWTPPLSLPNLQTHNFNTHSMSSWGTVQRTIDFLPFILCLTFLRYHRFFLCVLELKSLLKFSIW